MLSLIIYGFFYFKIYLILKNRILIVSLIQMDGTHNFQSDKAIDAISSGGYFGKGIGEGTL